MRVLLLTQFFDPEPTLKGLAFAKELQRRGFEVEVLTGFPNYPGGKVYDGYKPKLYAKETVEGVPVHRVWLYASHDASAKRRVLNYASFALSAALVGIWRVRKPDAVWVHHPPATISLPANLLRLLRRAPFVYEVQDLWPDTLAATGMLAEGRVTRLIGALMRRTYRRAAKVVVISEGFRGRLIERGVPEAKIAVVPNWCEEGRVRIEPRDEGYAAELGIPVSGSSAGFNLVFAGTMGLAQALDPVLDAARLLLTEAPEIRLVFVGGGIEKDRLAKRAEDEGLTNVVFLPRQPQEAMGRLLPLADALLVHLKDDPLFAITIPSKTQAALYAARPVLMAVRGDAAALVQRAGAGVLAEPESPRSLADAAKRLARLTPAERDTMGAAGRAHYDAHLSLTVGCDQYADILRQVGKP